MLVILFDFHRNIFELIFIKLSIVLCVQEAVGYKLRPLTKLLNCGFRRYFVCFSRETSKMNLIKLCLIILYVRESIGGYLELTYQFWKWPVLWCSFRCDFYFFFTEYKQYRKPFLCSIHKCESYRLLETAICVLKRKWQSVEEEVKVVVGGGKGCWGGMRRGAGVMEVESGDGMWGHMLRNDGFHRCTWV